MEMDAGGPILIAEHRKIRQDTRPGIVGASDRLYYRPLPLECAGVENRVQRGPPRQVGQPAERSSIF